MPSSLAAVKSSALPRWASAASSPLALWHLLSLDAPTVAALWTWFAARATHTPLAPAIPVAMFIAVWLLYAADRLLDARLIQARHSERSSESPYLSSARSLLESRHHFHLRHRRVFLAVTPTVAFALLALLPRIPPQTIRLYLLLGALLAAWFAVIHTQPRPETLPKELALGPFFAAAVFIPSFASASPALLLSACAFALLCTLNCLYIYCWEHEPHRAPSIAPLRWMGTAEAHASTRFCLRFLTPITLLTIVLPLLLILIAPALAPIHLAVASAAALLLLLHRFHNRFDRTHLRAAADLVLLTPLLIASFLR